MSIRWRLAILALQFLAIGVTTKLVLGNYLSEATWFAAMAALIINTQLLEPWFAKPVDTLANSAVGLMIVRFATKTQAHDAWTALAILLWAGVALASIALVLGAGARTGLRQRMGITARVLSKKLTAPIIYGSIFWLALAEFSGGLTPTFWKLSLCWVIPTILGAVNWQSAIAAAKGGPEPATIEGMIGPSKLLISSADAPSIGSSVTLTTAGSTASGIVVGRICRVDDVWIEVQVPDPIVCEALLGAHRVEIRSAGGDTGTVHGLVDIESTHQRLVFDPLAPLTIGSVVAVQEGSAEVLYQISSAEVRSSAIKGGASLTVRARANQLGIFDEATRRITRHRWVPLPGARVFPPTPVSPSASEPTDGHVLLGHVLGTGVPVFLDLDLMTEGHLVILGMTRMGKTTLALRLAKAFGARRATIVFDQTGEYRGKHGLEPYDSSRHDTAVGLSVFEPRAGKCIPDEGLVQLKHVVNRGYTEFAAGSPFPRTLIVDEAHQFVPEPALLGFGVAGRESAITFGMYMMQVRKYGISATLISQRTAVLAKSALSQCENVIAFKSVDQTGLEYLEAVLGPQARELLPLLNQGEALVFGPAVSSDVAVAIAVAR